MIVRSRVVANLPQILRLPMLALCAALVLLPATRGAMAQSTDVLYPAGSRLGLVPPPGMALSSTFPGFEDARNNVFIRLVPMPERAYSDIEKSMTNEAMKKQGMTVEKREKITLPGGSKGLLVVVRQQANDIRFRKWLLIAPISDITGLISFEIRDEARGAYPEQVIRAALTSATVRPTVPTDEQLTLVPFRVGDFAGLRVVRVLPGVALQLTDGPKDQFEATEQPHLVISIAPGGPPDARDRDSFARIALSNGLPPFKDVRITGSEPMRIGGQQGYEMRAEAKDPRTGADVEIVQWLRFGSGAFLRVVGFAPKEGWTQSFARFRTIRDAIEPR
jgi:hypothetical protein